jgi:hypothetical protein
MVTTRQRMPDVVVGIIDVRIAVTEEDTMALAAWIMRHRIEVLTGFFGNHPSLQYWVRDLAKKTSAVSWTPMYQAVRRDNINWVHPSFYLFFGFYKRIVVPQYIPEMTGEVILQDDIWNDMLPLKDVPDWPRNDVGSSYVKSFGRMTMKTPDWKKWFNGCFQTVLWLGTATPGMGSQERHQGKGKGKGEAGKHRGKRKGKGK